MASRSLEFKDFRHICMEKFVLAGSKASVVGRVGHASRCIQRGSIIIHHDQGLLKLLGGFSRFERCVPVTDKLL